MYITLMHTWSFFNMMVAGVRCGQGLRVWMIDGGCWPRRRQRGWLAVIHGGRRWLGLMMVHTRGDWVGSDDGLGLDHLCWLYLHPMNDLAGDLWRRRRGIGRPDVGLSPWRPPVRLGRLMVDWPWRIDYWFRLWSVGLWSRFRRIVDRFRCVGGRFWPVGPMAVSTIGR